MPAHDTAIARPFRVLGITIAVIVLVLASTHMVAANRQGDRSLTLLFHNTSFTSTQTDPSGTVYVQGDQLIGAFDILRSTTPHDRIGEGDLICLATGDAGATLHCEAAFLLQSGKIITETIFDFEDDWLAPTRKLAITGGTGAYRDATGELTVTTLASGDETGVFRFGN